MYDKEVKVKVCTKAFKYIIVNAKSREDAHKKAFNSFMDMPETEILKNSEIDDFFIETSIDGPQGGDMLHG